MKKNSERFAKMFSDRLVFNDEPVCLIVFIHMLFGRHKKKYVVVMLSFNMWDTTTLNPSKYLGNVMT
jgi:hypothetical protein